MEQLPTQKAVSAPGGYARVPPRRPVFTGLLRGEQLKLNVVLQSDEKIVREAKIRMESCGAIICRGSCASPHVSRVIGLGGF